MFNYQPIAPAEFGARSFRKPGNFLFTQQDNLVALGASEATTAMMWMALAFLEESDSCMLVGIQGLRASENLLVDKAGNWLTGFLPAIYQSYPFKLGTGPNNELMVCVDVDSGLIEDNASGIPFYDPTGQPSALVTQYMNVLANIRRDRESMRQYGRRLRELQLLEPWPLTVEDEESAHAFNGLLRINETRLNDLDAESYASLRAGGLILIIYSQLLSMQNLGNLIKLAQAHRQANATLDRPTEPILSKSDTISFDNL